MNKELKCEETGLFYIFKNEPDHISIRITTKSYLLVHYDESKGIGVKYISSKYVENPYTRLNIRLQCHDGEYLEVDTLCKELCYHLDRVELETYWFPDDISSVDQLKSKVCSVDINSFVECKRGV